MAIFANNPSARSDGPRRFNQGEARIVQLLHQTIHLTCLRSETLGVVIQMRKIDEGQVGTLVAQDFGSTLSNPLGRRQPRLGTPEGVKRKRAELAFEAFGQAAR